MIVQKSYAKPVTRIISAAEGCHLLSSSAGSPVIIHHAPSMSGLSVSTYEIIEEIDITLV